MQHLVARSAPLLLVGFVLGDQMLGGTCADNEQSKRLVNKAKVAQYVAEQIGSSDSRAINTKVRAEQTTKNSDSEWLNAPLESLTVSAMTSGARTSKPIRLFFLVPPRSAKSRQLSTRLSRVSSHACERTSPIENF